MATSDAAIRNFAHYMIMKFIDSDQMFMFTKIPHVSGESCIFFENMWSGSVKLIG